MNMKGGVGKTLVTANVAGMLAWYEWNGKPRRVLAIDYDPQFNLSQAFIPAKQYFELEKQGKTAWAILQDNEIKLDPFVIQTPGNHNPPSPNDISYRVHSTKA